MSIEPLRMPANVAALQEFEPQALNYTSPENGGRVTSVAAGQSLWQANWQLGKIGPRKSDALRAFVARLRGSLKRFYGRDVARPFPLAHIDGFAAMTLPAGGPFTGAAASWSQTIDGAGNAVLGLTGLPAGLILSDGDYVGFRWDAGEEGDEAGNMRRRALVRVVEEGGMASGAGAVTVMVEPPVPTLVVPGDAIAHLDNPMCVMVMLTDKSSLGAIDRRLALSSGTLVAVQDLRP